MRSNAQDKRQHTTTDNTTWVDECTVPVSVGIYIFSNGINLTVE